MWTKYLVFKFTTPSQISRLKFQEFLFNKYKFRYGNLHFKR